MMYEIMTVVPTRFSDAEIENVTGEIAKVIEAGGGKVEKTKNHGKIKLAYAIDHQRYGTYVLFFVEAATEAVAKIDQNLRLSEEVLRHIIVARPAGIPTSDYKIVSYQPPLSPEGRRSGEREERPTREARPAQAPVTKMSTEELSSKLDQILDSDIMKNV